MTSNANELVPDVPEDDDTEGHRTLPYPAEATSEAEGMDDRTAYRVTEDDEDSQGHIRI